MSPRRPTGSQLPTLRLPRQKIAMNLMTAYQTQTRWSPERDSWEVRLINPHGVEVARMSWQAWQQLSANRPFNSGPNPA